MNLNLSGEEILNAIREAGIVGGGGAGFPTHVKYKGQAEIVIVNGAECEPLLRVDQQLICRKTEDVIGGLKFAMTATGAKKGIIALKAKYKDAIKSVEEIIKYEDNLSLHIMSNYYPAGDEQTLVYEVTGRIVSEGAIPLSVGVVVSNVDTLYNVFRACLYGEPVITRPLTVTGEVENPLTVTVPVGMSIRDVINLAGGSKIQKPVILRGGPMMGHITDEMDLPITKTDSGIIVLPPDHHLVKNKTARVEKFLKMAKMCEGCTYCTMLCPRYLLGHNIEPHKIIRIVAYGLENASVSDLCQAFLCCQCGVCSLFACPLELQPREVYREVAKELKVKGIANPHRRTDLQVRSHMKLRRISAKGLVTKLEISGYDVKAPWKDMEINPLRVSIPLKQHIGSPCVPVIRPGDFVKKGQLIGTVPEGSMGASVHSSISGRVTEINSSVVVDTY